MKGFPSVSTSISYLDPKAALRWLEEAFGFEPSLVVLDKDENVMHSEMRFGDGLVMVGGEWDERHKSPRSVGGMNTQSVHLQLKDGIDAHCERARAAGAVILREPETQFYGDRSYMAMDPEGHVWSFGQTVAAVDPSRWDAEMGTVSRTRL
jgi:uncharacterized glyoxalase superfamily protein PhnB